MSTVLADKLDIVISLVVGIVITLYGFGKLGTHRGHSPDPRQNRFAKLAKWLGPLLIVLSAIRLLLK